MVSCHLVQIHHEIQPETLHFLATPSLDPEFASDGGFVSDIVDLVRNDLQTIEHGIDSVLEGIDRCVGFKMSRGTACVLAGDTVREFTVKDRRGDLDGLDDTFGTDDVVRTGFKRSSGESRDGM